MAFVTGQTPLTKRKIKRVDGRTLVRLLVVSGFCLVCSDLRSAETNSVAPEPAVAARDTNAFRLKPGFRMEVVASEPMVIAPVAMAFDENGRLFVAEMPSSANSRNASLGRVRMLENMSEDGVFQNSTIYADGLAWPSALACYAGGIFVATAPDIVYLKDTKGDGIADARQVVLSGFGGTNELKTRFLPNNFNWGPDNRIHASSGGVGGEISGNTGGGRVSIAYCDFSFDPRTLDCFAESGPSESGLSFDSRGRKFVTSFLRPLMYPTYRQAYALRNPFYPRQQPLSLCSDPLSPVYRFTGPLQNGTGTQATNTITTSLMGSACGTVVYRGRAFPTNYFDNVFVADPDAHIVHRLVLHENGLEMVAQRSPEEVSTEFVIGRDPSFRPLQIINGPDGCLYVADAQDGTQRGRIYRILPEKTKHSKPPALGKVKTYDLVSTLAQGDGWHRDTAARLLYERKDPVATVLLRATFLHSRIAQARVLSLQALAGAYALTEEDLLRAMADNEPSVRLQGILLSQAFLKNGDVSEALMSQFRALAQDPSIQVRYQLAFTLGELHRPEKGGLLAQILIRDFNNPWIQNAVFSSAANGAGDLFTVLAADNRVRNDTAGVNLLLQLATMIGISGHQDAVGVVVNFLARDIVPAAQTYSWLFGLGDGLYRTRSSLALVDQQGALKAFYSGALNLASDPSQTEVTRVAATRLLGVGTLGVGSVADWLLLVCSPPTTPALQAAAVEALSHYDEPQLINGFLQMWPILTPLARTRALNSLLSRDSQVMAVIDAIQSGSIPGSALSSVQRNLLRTHNNPQVRSRAVELFGPLSTERPQVRERFKASLTLRGTADRGQIIFRQRCSECHQSAVPAAEPFGPHLYRARYFSKEQLLSSILEPSQAVRADYATEVLESKEAQTVVGILADANSTTVTLKQIDGSKIVWPVENIRSLRREIWSFMPEGLENGLSPQDLADLMEYVHKGVK